MDVLKEWQTARDQLKHTTHTFYSACTTLYQAIENLGPSSVGFDTTEELLLKIHAQIDDVAVIERQMADSRAILHKVANKSTTLVPINVLPPEILCQIFSLVTSESLCLYDRINARNLHPLVVIPSVCARWRRLATATPSLWSHLDINEAQIYEQNENDVMHRLVLQLERAHGTPLVLDFWGEQGRQGANSLRLASVFQQRVDHITSVKFQHTSDACFRAVLDLLSSHGSPRLLTTFVANTIHSYSGTPRPAWPVHIFKDIVDLQLVKLHAPMAPNLDELALMLSNNRNLHTLRLEDVDIHTDSFDDGGEYPSLNLPHLRLLDLSKTSGTGCRLFLSLLTPGALELEVRLVVSYTMGYDGVIQALLRRSCVTRFVARGLLPFNARLLTGYIDCLPQVRTLVLDLTTYAQNGSLSALLKSDTSGETVARCPSLQALHLIGEAEGFHAQNLLKLIVTSHSLEEIKFGCDDNGSFDWL
ncbi:hypothetical protein FRC07_004500, partial [Ceratobasidium sp. 392]